LEDLAVPLKPGNTIAKSGFSIRMSAVAEHWLDEPLLLVHFDFVILIKILVAFFIVYRILQNETSFNAMKSKRMRMDRIINRSSSILTTTERIDSLRVGRGTFCIHTLKNGRKFSPRTRLPLYPTSSLGP
jgi:hypothetical protein